MAPAGSCAAGPPTRVVAAAEARVERVVVDEEPVPRELIDELDRPRLLVRRDPGATMIDELVRGRGGTLAQHDDRLDALHPTFVGDADDSRVSDRVVPREAALH